VYGCLFFEVKTRFNRAQGGDFTAYVIAQQNRAPCFDTRDISDEMRQMQKVSQTKTNKLSVALEFVFNAGVWTHYNQQMNTILEDGDIDGSLRCCTHYLAGDDAINLKCEIILFRNLYTGTQTQ
jgi:predicted metalloprotease